MKNMNCTCNHCFLYVSGLLLAFAYDDISYKKVGTQSHTYPGTGYDASKAVDGNRKTCMRTEAIGSNSADKMVWWKVDLGGIYNIYDINILFKTYDGFDDRQRGRFAGFSLYVSNTDVSSDADIKGSTLCYKDGPRLPSLNFTIICMQYGRYVIYYNERLEGMLYPSEYEVVNVNTELCEVKVQGCSKASFYGSICDTQCPVNCNDSTCHIHIGSCFNCTPGWTGMQCNTTCKEGHFGTNCSQICSPNCKPDTCRHTDGWCICPAGWMGNNCTIDMESYAISVSPSHNLPITVQSLTCACILLIIGVVLTICVIRQKSSSTMSNTSVHMVCVKSTPAAEESVNNEDLSNYQELNFYLQENPYQSMSR
nr:uncharacterized protein LOC105331044 [Crassostrea gigas]